MNYYDAAKIRKKGFANLMTDKLTSGQGVVSSFRGAMSERSKAKSMAMKEKFDPLNIAKFLTGGSKLAPAILGRLTGRSKEDIGYFTGKKQYQSYRKSPSSSSYWDKYNNRGMGGSGKATEVLEKIVSFMAKSKEDDKEEQDTLESQREMNELVKNHYHKEVMNVFTEAIKKKKKAMKDMAKESKKRAAQEKAEQKKKEAPAPTEAGKPPAPAPAPGKPPAPAPAPAPAPGKPPAPAPAPPAPAPVTPTVPKVPPTAAPAPPVAAIPKPSIVKPAITEAAKTAAKVAIGATGIFASSQAFTKTMYPYAKIASEKLGGKIPPEAILGQWSGETGGGKNLPADFNYAGIKAGKNDKKGEYVLTEERYTDEQIKRAEAKGETLHKVLGPKDTIRKKGKEVTIDSWFGKGEYDKAISEGKKWVQVRSYFAKFNSFEDFTNKYISFLSSPRYAKARESTDSAQFGLEVAKAGYATAAASKYSDKVSNFVKQNTELLDQLSKENRDMKDDISLPFSGASPTIIQNNTTNKQRNVTVTSDPIEELNPRMRR